VPSDTWNRDPPIVSKARASYGRHTAKKPSKELPMITRLTIAAMLAATTLVTATGCAVERHQETVGAYVDDSAVTTKVKAKFAEDKTVSAMAIKVDTMQGVVQLSGFAKSTEERMMAERLARDTNGVQGVRNDIIVK
jgi:osmotically-inducible protein OsmY